MVPQYLMSNEIVNGHTKKQFLQTKATAINIHFHFLLQKIYFQKKRNHLPSGLTLFWIDHFSACICISHKIKEKEKEDNLKKNVSKWNGTEFIPLYIEVKINQVVLKLKFMPLNLNLCNMAMRVGWTYWQDNQIYLIFLFL